LEEPFCSSTGIKGEKKNDLDISLVSAVIMSASNTKLRTVLTAEKRQLLYQEVYQKIKDTYGVHLNAMTLTLSESKPVDTEAESNGKLNNYLIPNPVDSKVEALALIGHAFPLEQQHRALELFWDWKNNYMTALFVDST
jgi:hypothetical protein